MAARARSGCRTALSTYCGDLLERLEISDGRVQLAFDGAGAQAIAFSVPS